MNIFSIITVSTGSETVTHRLPMIEKVDEFWSTLESIFEDLMCCENFYTQELLTQCTKCVRQSPAQFKRSKS